MRIMQKPIVHRAHFCEKILADLTVSRVFQNYFNFLPMLQSRNVIHMNFFLRQFIWDILRFLQVPTTFPLCCLSRHSPHAYFPCLFIHFHVFSSAVTLFIIFQPSLCNSYFFAPSPSAGWLLKSGASAHGSQRTAPWPPRVAEGPVWETLV